MIRMFKPYVNEKAIELVSATLRSGWIGEGPRVQEFEEALQERFDFRYCVALNSGTSATRLAMAMCGVGPGDEVLSVSQTCSAGNSPILEQFAVPVFCDIQYETGNIDPADIEHRITERTKAITFVHWAGYPADLDEIHGIAARYDLPVIEDAAHALGATYKDQPIGNISDFTMFSFQAIKQLTSVTPDTFVWIKEKKGSISLKRIGKLDNSIVGAFCASFDNQGKMRWGQIKGLVKHEVQDIILELILEKGRKIRITQNHSIFSYDGSSFITRKAGDLKVGDYIAVPRRLALETEILDKLDLLELLPDETLMIKSGKIRMGYEGRGANAGKWMDRFIPIDERFCKLLGYYVAEGCISKHYSRNGKGRGKTLYTILSFGAKERETYVKEVIAIFKSLFPAYSPHIYKVGPKKTGLRIILGSTLFSKIIKALNCGEGSHKKRIPDIIWRVSASCKWAFIDGLINGDGHTRFLGGTKYETLRVASEELALGLHYLLLTLNTQSSLATRINSKEGKKFTGYECVLISRGNQKQSRENTIPKDFVRAYNPKASFSLKRIRKENLDCPQNLLADVALLRVKSIEKKSYSGDVYDLSVEKYENFTGGFGAICLHNTADGGLLTMLSQADYDEARRRRWFGIDRRNRVKRLDGYAYWNQREVGYKYHMNDVAASIGLGNLEDIDEILKTRKRYADFYYDSLNDVPGVTLFERKPDRTSGHWLFTMHVENRDDFCRMMKSKGIEVSVCHIRNDSLAIFGSLRKDLPNTDRYEKTHISIPLHNHLNWTQVEYIAKCIVAGW